MGDFLLVFFVWYEDDECLNGNGMKRCLLGVVLDRELREEDRDDLEDVIFRFLVLELRSIGLIYVIEFECCVFWLVVGIL